MAVFDPYYIWLGIAPDEQPPDHYRLLGIRKFETNPDVIANAAEQRAQHIRSMHVGPRQADSQKLLNEIFAATRVLLDQQRKSSYDSELARWLRQCEGQLRSPVPAAVPVLPATALSPVTAPTPITLPAEQPQVIPSVVASSRNRTTPRRTLSRPAPLIAGWVLGLVLAMIACSVLYFSGLVGPQRRDNAAADPPKPGNEQSQVAPRPARPTPPAPAPSDPPPQPKSASIVVPPDSPAEKPREEVQSTQAELDASAETADSGG